MNSSIVVAMADLALLAGCFNAYAADGRIVFSGAIVEPTCSVEQFEVNSLSSATPRGVPRRLGCGQTVSKSGLTYSQTTTQVNTTRNSSDPLLDYFVSRDKPADVTLVVRTYQ